jgi:biotin carboxyl carrier protein
MPASQILIDGKQKNVELAKKTENAFQVKIDGVEMDVILSESKLQGNISLVLNIDGKSHRVELSSFERDRPIRLLVDNVLFGAEIRSPSVKQASTEFQTSGVSTLPIQRKSSLKQLSPGTLVAPMTGKVISVKVKKGDTIRANQVLCVIEAMKMENEIASSMAGTVQDVKVTEGSPVNEGDIIITIA